MKIFFDASITGKNSYGEYYQMIYEALKDVKGELMYSPVFSGLKEDIVKETPEEAEEFCQKLFGWIKEADIVIFEVSFPSLAIGHEIAMALQYGKPVIALHIEGQKSHILEGISQERLQMIEYDKMNIKRVLKEAVDYASGQYDTRFNFFISPKLQHYLNWITKTRMIPRAVYLRRLIEKEMEENEEYKRSV